MNNSPITIAIIILAIFGSFYAGYKVRNQSCTSGNTRQVQQLQKEPEQVLKPSTTPAPSLTPAPQTGTPAPQAKSEPDTEVVFTNYNIYGVSNGPTNSAVFTLSKNRTIYSIQTYHWNSARGKTPGTISVKSTDGTLYGPWTTKGTPGQGGVPDAYWTAYPDAELPAGTYTVIDSDTASWAHNTGTNSTGMTQVQALR